MSKLSDVQKIKRLYIWFIKQLSKSSGKMLQYIDKEDSTYYFISHSTIKKYINCNGDNFNKNILSNSYIWDIEKELKAHHSYRDKYLMIEKPIELQYLAMQ